MIPQVVASVNLLTGRWLHNLEGFALPNLLLQAANGIEFRNGNLQILNSRSVEMERMQSGIQGGGMTVIFIVGEPTRQENIHAVDIQVTPLEGVDNMGFTKTLVIPASVKSGVLGR
jgi:hypothetical protein